MRQQSTFGIPLERITLGEQVGTGASGRVFRARENQTGRSLAAKIFAFDEVDAAYRPRERFWRECRVLASLRDPAFPTLFGCGETHDGLGYAVMEWVDGKSLNTYRNASFDFVVQATVRLLLALRALHRHRVVHRDLSFDNILIDERWGRPRPRIIDLGACKDLDDVDLTLPGNFIGRLKYSAPEALTAVGSCAVRDGRADVFSLGVLLYEWLAGEPPFSGTDLGSIARSQQKGLAAPAVLPSRGIGGEELAKWTLSLLEPDPGKRPSAETALAALLSIRGRLRAVRDGGMGTAPEELVEAGVAGEVLLKAQAFRCEPSLERLDSVDRVVAWAEDQPTADEGPVHASGREPRHKGASSLVLVVGVVAFLGALAFAALVVGYLR